MNKKFIGVLAAVLLLAAVAFFATQQGGRGPGALKAEGPEIAIPQFDADDDYVFVRMGSMKGLRAAKDFLKALTPLLEDPEFQSEMRHRMDATGQLGGVDPGLYLSKAGAAMERLDVLDPLFDAGDETVLLAAPPLFCLSFYTDAARFDAVRSSDLMRGAQAWETALAGDGGEAWTWRADVPGLDAASGDVGTSLYIVRRAAGDRTHVLLSDTEEALARMVDAVEKPAARAKIERRAEGASFVQYRFPMTGVEGSSSDAVGETAWNTADGVTRVQAVSDLAAMGATPATSGMEKGPIPMFGSGTPLLFVTMDLPYFFSVGFPGEEDPVGFFMETVQQSAGQRIPPQHVGEIRAVLEGSRFSYGVTMGTESPLPTTAYVALETKAKSVVDQYFALAGFFLRPAQVEGWDTISSVAIRSDIVITAGRRGDLVVVGLGKPEEYAKTPATPKAMRDLPQTGVLMGAYFDASLLTDGTSPLAEAYRELTGSDKRFALLRYLESFDTIATMQADPQKSESRIYWKRK